MSATTTPPATPTVAARTTPTSQRRTGPARSASPIPFTRLMAVEQRKMFDTRAGFWLLASIGILSVLATGAAIAFAPDSALTYETFGTAVGVPMSIILPMIAILSVTGEYSQRTALTTYALVPRRGRVIGAKLAVSTLVGVAGMVVALGVGALGNLAGAAINGVDPVWDMSVESFAYIVLAMVLSMLIGFMLGVVLRNSPAAIVAYFVYSFVLPTIFGVLAAFQGWFADLQPWVDVNFAITRLYDTGLTAEQWAQLGVTTLIWLFLPLAAGLRVVMRSEVK